ncbi:MULTISPECIES: aconitate hydratase AcnA [Candidatus Nitrosocaldus]|jgi:aconitate hydratase|uniref:Aconitate hydratase n=1 Tax=Candidatus Nitrosocaldus cavascurensis TaxID=2058097 RepID=A0A2K5AST7_9ARCH|nr:MULTISPECIES: aconitate hydratase AcnA [Candidatus Nitrosocaldus]SPC34674.1 Aconitate hydratase [Candidatus Nitrosocaldus cavascurensis]
MQINKLDVYGTSLRYYDVSKYSWMPYTIRIVMESIARNIDGKSITEDDLNTIIGWEPNNAVEVPFKPARVIMQDYTGVPALVDLALMREIVAEHGLDPKIINPLVPVDLVIDHSVQVDHWASNDALALNMRLELERNRERYEFLKWAEQAFKNFRLFPPGTGIIHQVNLEYIAKVAILDSSTIYFDTCLGMDSHTTMINGLGVLGWGVGGIEAEAAVLGQPVSIVPEVVGVKLYNQPREGITATDIVLTLTDVLRRHNVVDKFLEFFGDGLYSLSVPDRATIANMAPEYGATAALFPVDDETIKYLMLTGRDERHVDVVKAYYKAQGMYGSSNGDVHYSKIIEFDLSSVEPSIAGPSLPWERRTFKDVYDGILQLTKGRSASTLVRVDGEDHTLADGSIVIAAITSCTNTSNPYLMVAAALLAKKAYELGLRVPRYVKSSLAPGSRVVESYLARAGLLHYLELLGFNIVGYGCTTCIGNSGPLPAEISDAIRRNGLTVVAVLSGNRNFEGRIHPDVRANYLMSPPLVVAYALAGRIKDLSKEPLGYAKDGSAVYLRDVWPSSKEVEDLMSIISKDDFARYSTLGDLIPEWDRIKVKASNLYEWDDANTFIKRPPFLDDFDMAADRVKSIRDARALLILGDNVTTDHISPAGPISPDSDAGRYLISLGVNIARLNTFGARRGNWEVMVRGTFTGRIENKMLKHRGEVKKGGYTIHYPSNEVMSVYDAAMRYKREGVPLIVIAGKNYGAGSSRDWAAKGPKLLGVRAVIAESFERIHRSNLVEMGILPLQFMDGASADTLGIRGDETFDIMLDDLKPRKVVELVVHRSDGSVARARLLARIDTEMELRYYMAGGILHYVLSTLMNSLQ